MVGREEDDDRVQTRAFGGTPVNVWTIGEDLEIGDEDADVLIHFLQSRAAERIMMAQEKLSEALGVYRRAQKFLAKEEGAVAVFLNQGTPYTSTTRRELLTRVFPERLRAADLREVSENG